MMTDEEFDARRNQQRELRSLSPINKINMTRDAAWTALQAASTLNSLVFSFDYLNDLPSGTAFEADRIRNDLSNLWRKLVDAGMEN